MNLEDRIEEVAQLRPYTWNPRVSSTLARIESVTTDYLEPIVNRNKDQFNILSSSYGGGIFNIIALTARCEFDIPGFRVPVWTVADDNDINLVVDLRAGTAVDRDRELRITNQKLVRFERYRAALSILFTREPDVTAAINSVFGRVFIELFKTTIGRQLQLEPGQQDVLRLLAANYWYTMFETKPEFNIDDTRAVNTRIDRIARLANSTPELYRLVHDGAPITTR